MREGVSEDGGPGGWGGPQQEELGCGRRCSQGSGVQLATLKEAGVRSGKGGQGMPD